MVSLLNAVVVPGSQCHLSRGGAAAAVRQVAEGCATAVALVAAAGFVDVVSPVVVAAEAVEYETGDSAAGGNAVASAVVASDGAVIPRDCAADLGPSSGTGVAAAAVGAEGAAALAAAVVFEAAVADAAVDAASLENVDDPTNSALAVTAANVAVAAGYALKVAELKPKR